VGTGLRGTTRATGAGETAARPVCTAGTAAAAGLDITRFGVDVSTARGRSFTRGSVVRVATRVASWLVATRKDAVPPVSALPPPVTVSPGETVPTADVASTGADAAEAGAAGAAADACGAVTVGEAGTSDAGWTAGAGVGNCGDGAGGAAGGAADAGVGAADETETGAGDCTGGGASAGTDRGGSRLSGST
jgi:hypothetical protein